MKKKDWFYLLSLVYFVVFAHNVVFAEGTTQAVVITTEAYNITADSVTFGGKFTSPGDSFVTDFGFEYGTTISYGDAIKQNSYVNEPTVFGLSTSPNGSNLTWAANLKCGTLYHYRAYATNSAGRSYGDDMTFTTLKCDSSEDTLRVETLPVVDITDTSVIFQGNLVSMGNVPSVNVAFDYAKAPNGRALSLPLLPISNVGTFKYPDVVTGLECNTKYTYHVEAVKPKPAPDGTAIIATGSKMSFTTLSCTEAKKEVVKKNAVTDSDQTSTPQGIIQVQVKNNSDVTVQDTTTAHVVVKSSVETKTFKQKFFNLFKKLKFW